MAASRPTFGAALKFWLKLGFISFGGPTGQIAIMHTELVEKRKWIGEQRFLHALNFCMLLPGPEAQQLATYCGWLLHRTWGGIVAGTLFVLPAAVLLWGLAWVYAVHGSVPWIAALFYGLKPAVVAIVAVAVLRIGRRVLTRPVQWVIALAAFVAIFFLQVPFPAIIAGAALAGVAIGRWQPGQFPGAQGHAGAAAAVIDDRESASGHSRPSWGRALRVVTVAGALWWLPVLAVGVWQGWDGTLAQIGFFFSKAAMVTFGGAYAVLPYVAQQAVENYAWLSPAQMLDGLGLAEAKPGPLIMVVQFVAFLGGWNHPGALPPFWTATLGAMLATWVTFVPCFMWIFLGAPHIEQLRGHAGLHHALTAVTAAVVGVVLNLAVWFGWHVFVPSAGSPDWPALGLAGAAFVALHWLKAGTVTVVFGGALAGIALGWLGA
ncbi:MAG: chromate efflux transporter [Opitutaceae bacterium]|nr:chromate efflux transporter [Opitutaceae bacterium]